MRFKVVGSKRDIMATVIRNSDTIIIKAGSPVFLAVTGTEDGLRAVSSNNLAAALQGNFFGFAYALQMCGLRIRQVESVMHFYL